MVKLGQVAELLGIRYTQRSTLSKYTERDVMLKPLLSGEHKGSGTPVEYSDRDVVVMAAWLDCLDQLVGDARERLLRAVFDSEPGDWLVLVDGLVTTVYRPRWDLVS